MKNDTLENGKKAGKLEIFSWCAYDFANSSYSTIIVTVAFSIYFTSVVAEGQGGERLWGYANSVSMLAVAIMSPMLGAIADYGALKKRFLVYFTLLCVFSTAMLFYAGRGELYYAAIVFTLANIGFNAGLHFYNSFLIDISTRENIGRISGYGWSFGYVGGLISLVIAYPLIKGGLGEENLANYRLSFLLTSVFFLVCAIPTFLYLKERALPHRGLGLKGYVKRGYSRIHDTFHEIRKFKELTKYFFCYLLYTDAVSTIIVFSAVFASGTLKMSPGEIAIYFIITQITASLGALAFGPFMDKYGAKLSISLTLIALFGVTVAAYFVQTKQGFYWVGLIAGAVLGANQSSSRALLGLFTPRGKNAEFFGFFSLVGKFAAIIGPIVYGEVSAHTGSQRIAVLTIGTFFIIGLILMQSVNVKSGIEAAKDFEKEVH